MYYLGIDLGGTNIALGIVDENGNILCKGSTPTPQQADYKTVMKCIAEFSIKLVTDNNYKLSDIKAVGIGCPGSIDYKNKIVADSNNVKIDNAPIVEEFHKFWDVSIFLENDANAAAYGEYIINGNNADVFIAVTLGTGIGGGIIIGGEIFTGHNGAGGELGHILLTKDGIPCTCGRKGCWEAYASATALINQTTDAIKENPESLMSKYAKESGRINGKIAFDAAKQGDQTALNVVNTYIEYVAAGLVDIVNIFQPQKIVIGGGISNQGEYLLAPIREYVKKYDYNQHLEPVKIETATLLNDAGIIGAAFAAKNFG